MKQENDSKSARFTAREKEILNFIAEGLSSREIARQLMISENTVSNHRKNMLRKNGVKKSVDLFAANINNFLR